MKPTKCDDSSPEEEHEVSMIKSKKVDIDELFKLHEKTAPRVKQETPAQLVIKSQEQLDFERV